MEFTWLRERLRPFSDHNAAVYRIGLGLVMLGAGTHQLVRPTAWVGYMAPLFASILSSIGISPTLFLQFNGASEVVLGIAHLTDQYTTVAAALAAMGLLSILVNLVIAPNPFIDIIVRDLGLFFLAVGVTLQSAGD